MIWLKISLTNLLIISIIFLTGKRNYKISGVLRVQTELAGASDPQFFTILVHTLQAGRGDAVHKLSRYVYSDLRIIYLFPTILRDIILIYKL